MREIKFRAWDGKRLSEPFTILDIISDDHTPFENHIPNVIKVKGKNKLYTYYLSKCEIIHFTGFKDKNKKEIFEGYIMKLENMPKGIRTNYEVIFEDGKFICAGMDIPHILDFCDGKIIGNKFENPELLEEKK